MKPFLCSLALLWSLSASAPAVCTIARPDGERLILENDRLRCAVNLGSCGRIESLVLKKTGEEMLEPLVETVDRYSPLVPPLVKSNNGGFKEMLWGMPTGKRIPFSARITAEKPDCVEVRLEGELGLFDVVRIIRLEDHSHLLRERVSITNRSDTAEELHYWVHALLNPKVFLRPDSQEGVFAFSSAGPRVILSKKTEAVPEKVVNLTLRSEYAFYAPKEGWGLRQSPLTGTALLLETASGAFAPDGMLSVWNSRGTTSLELILAGRKVAPGRHETVEINLAVVPEAGKIVGYTHGVLLDATPALLRARNLGAGSSTLTLPTRSGKSKTARLRGDPVEIGTPGEFGSGEFTVQPENGSPAKGLFFMP